MNIERVSSKRKITCSEYLILNRIKKDDRELSKIYINETK